MSASVDNPVLVADVGGTNLVTAPLLFIVGDKDKMTPPKAAQVLVDAAMQAGKSVTQVNVDAGHAMMVESPSKIVQALHAFLQK